MTTPKIRPEYKSPRVVTYREDEILKQMGAVGGCNDPTYDPQATAPRNLYRRYPGKRGQKYRSSLRAADLEAGIRRDEEDLYP